MNVVILGAGTVGSSIAELLCANNINVTIVDSDPAKIASMNDELDVRALTGNASESSVLFQTGISTADVVLAVTGCDEVNIVSGSIAKAMGAKRAIARVYAPVFRDLSTFDYQKHFGLDRMLSLEHLAAMELARGIRDPGSVVIEQFAHGEMEVLVFDVSKKCKVLGQCLRDLELPANFRIATIFRDNRMWIATADDKMEVGDQVTVISRKDNEKVVRDIFRQQKQASKRICIAGGGETGFHLARTLTRENFLVTLFESDENRCKQLANSLKDVVIVHCDATRGEVLEEERVGNAEVFIACIGDDENNIVACVEAKEIGAKKVMAIVGRSDYDNIIGKLGIDLAVSEHEVMAKQVMNYLSEGVVNSMIPLIGGDINVVEIEVPEGVAATEGTLSELKLPPQTLIGAIISSDFVRVPDGRDSINAGERVVLLVARDSMLDAVSLFEKKIQKKKKTITS